MPLGGLTVYLSEVKILVSAIFAVALASAAPGPPIGIVTASGHFTFQGSQVWGNATLFEGAIVETGEASSQLALRSGIKVQLGAGARAQVFADRLVLAQGLSQVGTLQVRGEPGSRVRIALGPRVEVAALTGVARVSTTSGVPLASIQAPNHMSFAMQQAASLTRTGCLLYKDNHFILQDDNTQEVLELNGQDLAANVGNRVEITGMMSTAKATVAPATGVFNVMSVSPRSQGGCLVVASSLQAQAQMPAGTTPAPAAKGGPARAPGGAPAAKTGMSTGAKVGIVAAVAGGGAGAAIALAGGKKSTSP